MCVGGQRRVLWRRACFLLLAMAASASNDLGADLLPLVNHVLDEVGLDDDDRPSPEHIVEKLVQAQVERHRAAAGSSAATDVAAWLESTKLALQSDLKDFVVQSAPSDWVETDIRAAVDVAIQEWLKQSREGKKRPISPSSKDVDPAAKRSTMSGMELVLSHPWCGKQCWAMLEFVVDGEMRAREMTHRDGDGFTRGSTRQDLWVACECNSSHFMRADQFPTHVLAAHSENFVDRCGAAEAEAAKQMLGTAREMLAEVQLKVRTKAEADAACNEAKELHAQLADLATEYERIEAELAQKKGDATYFEAKTIALKAEVGRLVQQREQRGWRTLCPTAELHQTLYERGDFDPASSRCTPLNRTLDELHYLSLKRVEVGPEGVRRGGQPMQITQTARALACALYNRCFWPAYGLLQKIYLWLPRRTRRLLLPRPTPGRAAQTRPTSRSPNYYS